MPDRQSTLFAVILAAGRSSRFGATKQTVEFEEVPLVQRAAETAAAVCGERVITIIGHDRENVLDAMNSQSGFVLVNEDYEDGLGTSIAAAARVCRRCSDAMLLLLADQPLVTAEHLENLIAAWSGSSNEIVSTTYDGTRGPPVLFPRNTFEALCRLSGDRGARAVLRDPRYELKTVRFEPAAIDIDTPDDLALLT